MNENQPIENMIEALPPIPEDAPPAAKARRLPLVFLIFYLFFAASASSKAMYPPQHSFLAG